MTALGRLLTLFLITAILLGAVPSAQAQTPPDEIKGYSIAIEPQSDGALKINYIFDYCATTDFPSTQFDAGVPNSNFELLDAGPSEMVASASPYTSGGSWVRFQFAHVPKAGECFNFYFTVLQRQMAYPSETGVSFVFTPSWFNFAKIDIMRLTWKLPDDVSLVRGFDPAPKSQENGLAVWEVNDLAPDQKFTIKVMIDQTAFGELAQPAPSPEATQPGGGGDPVFLCLVVGGIVVVLVLIVILLLWLSDGSGGSYSGGSYIGGHSSSGSGGRSGGSSSGGRSGGGSGSFGGRGSSCACVSCACACACAGSSRVGCSERGFDISRLLKKKC